MILMVLLTLDNIDGGSQPAFLDLILFKNLGWRYLSLFLLALLSIFLVISKEEISFLSFTCLASKIFLPFRRIIPRNLAPVSTEMIVF